MTQRLEELRSLTQQFLALTSQQRTEFIKELSDEEIVLLRWYIQRRPAQTAPEPLPYIWFLLGGRGSGKTWTAANHLFEYCLNLPHTPKNRIVRVALIGETNDDIRKTMVEGETGLLAVIPESQILAWNRVAIELKVEIPGPPYRKIEFSAYSSETPGKLRGPQQHAAWIDEPAKLADADVEPTLKDTTWSNLSMGLRLGPYPHVVVTGTPTPCKLVKYLKSHPQATLSHMTSIENWANMPTNYKDELQRLDPNSRTYRQEVLAEILDDNPDALFSEETIHSNRQDPPQDTRKVLGYDPAASSSPESDETGLILVHYTTEVTGVTATPEGKIVKTILEPAHAYPTKDLSGHYTPSQQTTLVISTVLEEEVEDLVFEQNQGVEFIMDSLTQALKDQTIQYTIRKEKKARKTDYGSIKRFQVSVIKLDGTPFKFQISSIHAGTNKKVRAETASIRYDTGQVHHPSDPHQLPTCLFDTCKANLEGQMTAWNPTTTKKSPDRLDALVYALLHIFGSAGMRKQRHASVTKPETLNNPITTQNNTTTPARKRLVSLYSVDIMEKRTLV